MILYFRAHIPSDLLTLQSCRQSNSPYEPTFLSTLEARPTEVIPAHRRLSQLHQHDKTSAS